MLANSTTGLTPAAQRTAAVGDPARGPAVLAAETRWRIIPAVDKDPRIVGYVQTGSGRVLLLAIVIGLAAAVRPFGVDLTVAPLALACGWAGAHRRYLIPLATLLLLYANGFWVNTAAVQDVIRQEGLSNRLDAVRLIDGSVLAFAAACSVLMAMWPRLSSLPVLRRPTLCLILLFVMLAVVAQSPVATGLPRALLWSFVLVFQPYLWFLAYALPERDQATRRPVWQHLGVFHPFWGSTATPFGKGLSYLARRDAKTPEELAVTQLKGVKLACWVVVLVLCLSLFGHVVHDVVRLPRFDDAFLGFLGGTPAARLLCWASLVSFFFEDVLHITIWGGAIVACARLAGFRLLRNTYRPLEARTLAAFWNRYYFYYKELLVDHFFYPVFLRCFRKNRQLRIFFATFMAACVGNLLFHFIRDIYFVAEMGWGRALAGEASHAFYTFLLAVGVGISQMRSGPQPRGEGGLGSRLLPCLWVGFFFCILHVFDAPQDRVHTIGQRAGFLFYLLGIDTWI